MKRKYPNRPSQINDYYRHVLRLDGTKPRQWEADIITVHTLVELAHRQEEIEMMALMMGAKLT